MGNNPIANNEMRMKAYEEVGNNYRYFLGWRHAAFAGYMIVLYGIISLSVTLYEHSPIWTVTVLGMGGFIGHLLWMIDVRTRDLYHAAIKAGKHLEKETGGFYTQVSEIVIPRESSLLTPSQTFALRVLFQGSSIVLELIAVVIFLMVIF